MEEASGCVVEGCTELRHCLLMIFGEEWRNMLFGGDSLRQFDIGEVQDLSLLLGLGNADSFQFQLLHLLGQRSRKAMMAHRLVCAWVQNKEGVMFPGEEDAETLFSCVGLAMSNLGVCTGASELLHLPSGVLALLNLRLGCRLARSVCCTTVCWLGAGCGALARTPEGILLCDSRSYGIAGALRAALVSKVVTLEVMLFSAVVALRSGKLYGSR